MSRASASLVFHHHRSRHFVVIVHQHDDRVLPWRKRRETGPLATVKLGARPPFRLCILCNQVPTLPFLLLLLLRLFS